MRKQFTFSVELLGPLKQNGTGKISFDFVATGATHFQTHGRQLPKIGQRDQVTNAELGQVDRQAFTVNSLDISSSPMSDPEGT